jgi:hypothetical protein
MSVPASFAYVDPPDVPEGVTLDDYRRAGSRPADPPAPRRDILLAVLTYPIRLLLHQTGRDA